MKTIKSQKKKILIAQLHHSTLFSKKIEVIKYLLRQLYANNDVIVNCPAFPTVQEIPDSMFLPLFFWYKDLSGSTDLNVNHQLNMFVLILYNIIHFQKIICILLQNFKTLRITLYLMQIMTYHNNNKEKQTFQNCQTI